MRNLHHLTCNNIAKLLVSYDTYLKWSMTKQIKKTRPAFNNVKPRGVARYFFVRSILMMASFHTFASEVCKNILLEGLFQNFKLYLEF